MKDGHVANVEMPSAAVRTMLPTVKKGRLDYTMGSPPQKRLENEALESEYAVIIGDLGGEPKVDVLQGKAKYFWCHCGYLGFFGFGM
jgi:hypothetical protein